MDFINGIDGLFVVMCWFCCSNKRFFSSAMRSPPWMTSVSLPLCPPWLTGTTTLVSVVVFAAFVAQGAGLENDLSFGNLIILKMLRLLGELRMSCFVWSPLHFPSSFARRLPFLSPFACEQGILPLFVSLVDGWFSNDDSAMSSRLS